MVSGQLAQGGWQRWEDMFNFWIYLEGRRWCLPTDQMWVMRTVKTPFEFSAQATENWKMNLAFTQVRKNVRAGVW